MASKDDGVPYTQLPNYILQVVKAVRQGVYQAQAYGGPMLMPAEIVFDVRVILGDNELTRQETSETEATTDSTPGVTKTTVHQPTTTTATAQPSVEQQNTNQFQQGGGSNRRETRTEYETRS